MKTIYLAAAAILMASTAAHAGNGISFEINGQKIHVEAPRSCDALSCIKITAPGLNLKGLNLGGSKDDDDTSVASTAPAPTTTAAPAVQATAPQATPSAATQVAPAQPAPAVVASTAPITSTYVAPAAPAPVAVAAPANPAPAAVVAPQPQPPPVAKAPAPAPTTPLGLWATEENKGNVRIEQCGANLCGYADKSGEKILINMKPSDSKWTGRIHDPDSGGNYDSTIAMKGPNVLKVQGCAFGGMFCGGQTWKRVS
jgi:uncharacterized protein (DUF2147 family)